ncbi:MAG TPA: hypothetical protein PKI71_05740 [Candidatus Rifleibacterium sp.]|nr:hypothetical protein [Candidatus Rifleibacterium sp.]
MNGIFRIEEAISAAGRVAYLAAKILKNDMSRMSFYNNQDIKELNIEDREWNFLNALKRQPDKSTFYYWYQVVQLLKNS